MANAVVEIAGLPTGMTLTGDFYPRGSDTVAASGKSFTERTNCKTVYRCTVTEGLAGWHRVVVKNGSDVVAILDAFMSDDTTDHYAYDREQELDFRAHGAGVAQVNVDEIDGSAASATNLERSASTIIRGTVSTAGFAPTTTQFECGDITEATADHFNGLTWKWTSGALAGQGTLIEDYSLVTGRGHFTVRAMTEAPANNDTGVII